MNILNKLLFASLFSLNIFAFCSTAQAQTPAPFSISKNLCTGVPTLAGNSEGCATAQTVSANSPVYYVISLTNPFGVPAQTVALTDPYPAGFTPSAGMFCKDSTGAVVTFTPNPTPNGIGTVALAVNTTVHCFIPGSFSTTGIKANTVTGSSQTGSPTQATVNTNVLQAQPLPADLAVVKTAAPAAVNVTSGPAFITYTIVITNLGPATATVGDYFKLYDNLSLPSNGVPLNVSYVSASCASSPGTDCLDPAGPTLTGGAPTFVPSSSPRPFLEWQFANAGVIPPGGSITLTIVVKVEQLSGLSCVAQLNANGIRNTVFFTLTDVKNGIALNDINPSNNTSSVSTPVETGQTDVIEGCGKGHLLVKKTPIAPLNPTPWGSTVKYKITIKNLSVPNQPITINGAQFQDIVTEGINTPPFTRLHVSTTCISSTGINLCPAFNPGIVADPDFKYSYYGQPERAWVNNKKITLTYGQEVTFETSFIYENPDCETVPLAGLKPIQNTAVVSYLASAYGAASNTPQATPFTVSSTTQTNMERNKACEFVVTKTLGNSVGRIQFGVPISYQVTFTNNGAPRTVGTLLDAVRITKGNYASSLPFTSSWVCKQSGGVSGFSATGSISSGAAVFTGSPAQGAPAANIGSNVMFGTNSTLTCEITITVNRPAFNDPFCTQDPVEFENMALMDVTKPFNNNIAWPPSATYNPALPLNPVPQTVNWATAKMQLPACWDAMINKQAAVAGLPNGSAPWTYVGGPAVDYTIATTNLGKSNLGTATPHPGWSVVDTFSNPYTNANAVAVATPCPTPSGWCHTTPLPHDGKTQIGVKSLTPNQTGYWNLNYPGPFTLNQPITNCAKVQATGVYAGPNYYPNSNPANPIEQCKTVPVVAVTKISTTKVLVDQTGANVKVGGPYNVSINCTPYALQTSQSSFGLTTGATGQSPANVTANVPVSSTCTIAETSNPIPAASAAACGGANFVATNTTISPLPSPLNSTNNNVTITNTLTCLKGSIEVKKQIIGIVGVAVPTQTYIISASCSPSSTLTSVTISASVGAGGGSGTATFTAPLGASCALTEQPPAVPASLTQYCASQGKGPAQWLAPVFIPYSTVTATNPKTAVIVQNEWQCGPAAPLGTSIISITKLITVPPLPNGNSNPFPTPTLAYPITANCSPSATPTSVTITTNGVANNTASMNVPTNATCAFTETLPPIPAAYATHGCPGFTPAQMLVWDTPLFSPSQPMTVTATGQSLTVTNRMKCAPIPPTIITYVKKVVTGPSGALPLPPIAYQVSSNCSPAGTAPGTVSIGPASGLFPMYTEIGAVCNFSEAPPVFPSTSAAAAAALCPQGTLTWSPPAFSPAGPLTITNATQTMTVTNNWSCSSNTPAATIVITKVVTGTGTGPSVLSPNMQFPIFTNCSSPSTPSGVTLTNAGTGTVTATVGAVCNLSETQPPFPPPLMLCAAGQTATWDPPVFSPSGSITLASGVTPVTVTNNWKCVANSTSPGAIQVIKKVTGSGFAAGALSPMTFDINSNCGNVSATASSGNGTYTGGTVSAPVGTSCQFTEKLPQFVYADNDRLCPHPILYGLVWDAPTYSPAASLTVSGVTQTINVTNNWKCVPSQRITVVKTVVGPATVTAMPFAINSNCGNVNITTNGTSPKFANPVIAPLGTTCSFSETQPAFNPDAVAACTNGNVPKWSAPVFSAQSVTINASGSQEVTVTNTWSCLCPTCRAIAPAVGTTAPDTSNLTIINRVAGPRLVSFFEPFTVTANCLLAASPSARVAADGTAVLKVAVGASCRLSQTQPAFNLAANGTCSAELGQGALPKWDAPIFSAGQPMRIGATDQTVTVTNNWRCVKPASNVPPGLMLPPTAPTLLAPPRAVTGSPAVTPPVVQPVQPPIQPPVPVPGTLPIPFRP